MFEIKHKETGEVICSGETVRGALEAAVESNMSLEHADLSEVDWGSMDMESIFGMLMCKASVPRDYVQRVYNVGPYRKSLRWLAPGVVEEFDDPE